MRGPHRVLVPIVSCTAVTTARTATLRPQEFGQRNIRVRVAGPNTNRLCEKKDREPPNADEYLQGGFKKRWNRSADSLVRADWSCSGKHADKAVRAPFVNRACADSAAHLDAATNGVIEWWSTGLRPGVSGSGSCEGAVPEAGAPVAASRCTPDFPRPG